MCLFWFMFGSSSFWCNFCAVYMSGVVVVSPSLWGFLGVEVGGWCMHVKATVAPSVCRILRSGTTSFLLLPCEAFSLWTGILPDSALLWCVYRGLSQSRQDFWRRALDWNSDLHACKGSIHILWTIISGPVLVFLKKIHLPFRISLYPSCSCFSPLSLYRFYPALFPSQIQINALLSWLIFLGFVCWDWRTESSFLWLLFSFCWEIFFLSYISTKIKNSPECPRSSIQQQIM